MILFCLDMAMQLDQPQAVTTTKLFHEIDELLDKGYSTEKVYCHKTKKKEHSICQTVTGPKMIDNRKYTKKTRKTWWKETESEAENLVSSLRETDSMVQTVIFCKEQYISVNVLPQMINNLFR